MAVGRIARTLPRRRPRSRWPDRWRSTTGRPRALCYHPGFLRRPVVRSDSPTHRTGPDHVRRPSLQPVLPRVRARLDGLEAGGRHGQEPRPREPQPDRAHRSHRDAAVSADPDLHERAAPGLGQAHALQPGQLPARRQHAQGPHPGGGGGSRVEPHRRALRLHDPDAAAHLRGVRLRRLSGRETHHRPPLRAGGMTRPRILSGMRPTGPLHIGHLTGALDNWVRLMDTYECFFAIVDWHALTTDYADPKDVRENVLEVATDWLAAGLDPTRSTLFVQSLVPEHAELHLLLSMIVPVPWLERGPSYKEQQTQLPEKDLSTYGFLGYPLLQSADIMIYKAHAVPVGEDQAPHVELTREVVRRFNHFYGPVFPEPKTLLTEVPPVPGTDGR